MEFHTGQLSQFDKVEAIILKARASEPKDLSRSLSTCPAAEPPVLPLVTGPSFFLLDPPLLIR